MGLMKRFAGSPGRIGRGRTFLEVDWFFDNPKIVAAVDDASRRNLSRAGAFVRQSARQSIRKPRRKRLDEMSTEERRQWHISGEGHKNLPFAPSDPGTPPRNVTGRLKGNIFFWYDRNERSVTVGAPAFDSRDVPWILEHGGVTKMFGKVINVAARPYMLPALERVKPKLEQIWANSVRTR